MSKLAKEWRSVAPSEGFNAPQSPSRGKAASKTNGLLSRKPSGGDTPKLANGTGASQRLAAKLSELLSNFQVSMSMMAQGL